MAISSPPQYQAGTGLRWGTFPMERPCSSISFSSQPSLGFGGACSHPVPHICLSGGFGQASHFHLSCPRYLPAAHRVHIPLPGTSGLQLCASSSCPSAGIPWTLRWGNGPAERFWHHWREKTAHEKQQDLLWLQKKNRQQVPAWPREQQPDSLRTQSRPEAPWAAPTHKPDL